MALADELTKLEQLHARGSLSAAEYQRAKSKLLETSCAPIPAVEALNGLRRSSTDRWIGGVCGGLSTATGIAAWVLRMVFVLLTIAGGAGLITYLILWFFVPVESVARWPNPWADTP
jgi:phage shock protein PspC (stress-responsive transcriptional regulator)